MDDRTFANDDDEINDDGAEDDNVGIASSSQPIGQCSILVISCFLDIPFHCVNLIAEYAIVNNVVILHLNNWLFFAIFVQRLQHTVLL